MDDNRIGMLLFVTSLTLGIVLGLWVGLVMTYSTVQEIRQAVVEQKDINETSNSR